MRKWFIIGCMVVTSLILIGIGIFLSQEKKEANNINNNVNNNSTEEVYNFDSNWNYDMYPEGDADYIYIVSDFYQVGDEVHLYANDKEYGLFVVNSFKRIDSKTFEIDYTYKNINYDAELIFGVSDFHIIDAAGETVEAFYKEGKEARSIVKGEECNSIIEIKFDSDHQSNGFGITISNKSFVNSKRKIEYNPINAS